MAAHDPYAPFRQPGYPPYIVGRFFYTLAMQMQTVAVSWQIYERLRGDLNQVTLALGYIGLALIIPVILFALPAGYVADRFNRRQVILAMQLLFALTSAAMLILSVEGAPLGAFYAVLFVSGISRAFTVPAVNAFYAMLVPREALPNASAWNSTVFEIASMTGPALGGLVIALSGAQACYYVILAFVAVAFVLTTQVVPLLPQPPKAARMSIEVLLSGVRFVFRTRLLLALMSLDLITMLLGGATALLPIFASDILHGDATAYGLLRAAPACGAIAMAMVTTHLPPWRRAGRVLLWSTLAFGLATIFFGLSRTLGLSLLALILTGMFDNISVVIRQTVVQLLTPNEMRGRVSAISFLFVSCSNELGEFESGVSARFLGPVGSVLLGGVGTVVIVGATAWLAPEIRRLGVLRELKPVAIQVATADELASRW